MDRLEAAKAKDLRRTIIETLYRFYGDDITVSTLKNVIIHSGYNTDSEIKRAIFYLTGAKKEYVKLVYNNENYMDSLIWLTPIGVNLAEGDITDVGVLINE